MAKAAAKKAALKVDPFKVRKSREEPAAASDTLTPPAPVARAIDAFREAQDQAKHFEGEATVYKDTILEYTEAEFAKRAARGLNKSFKVLGEESMITYVIMDASAGLSDEDVEEFGREWGHPAAEDLIVRDFASVRFDAEVLEAHYDEVVSALQVLPPEVLERLFKPMLMRARRGALEGAKRYAKTPEKLREILKQLKIKNYVR